MSDMMSNVIMCPKCGIVQASQAAVVFKCRGCGVASQIKSKAKLGLSVKVLATFQNPLDAAAYVQEYTKRIWEMNEEKKL